MIYNILERNRANNVTVARRHNVKLSFFVHAADQEPVAFKLIPVQVLAMDRLN